MKEKQQYRMGVGASSILMIIVVLCITALSVLSFSNARANLTLAQRRQSYIEESQRAAAEAQRVLSRVDALLLEAGTTPDVYEQRVLELELPDVELTVSEDLVITFQIPFGEEQALEMSVRANGADADTRYSTVSYQRLNLSEWEPETDFFLFD